MRFNVISESGDGAGFAVRLTHEGEDVRLWIRDAEAKSVADNLVTKVGDLADLVHDADTKKDIFIFDTSGNGLIADFLTGRGYATLGGSVVADRLERDRDFGSSVMTSCGIEIPPTESFDSFDKARKFIEKNDEARFVYKPSKQLGDMSPSHVSYDAEDLIEMLNNIEQEVEIAEPEFDLQLFVKGVAFSTELWFNHGELLPLTNHTLERKHLMNDDLGPSTGCAGNVTWFCDGCRICEVAEKLVLWIGRQRYHGPIDLNVIVAEDGVYGLEFTPRFGYDATPTLLWELVNHPLGQFFAEAAKGTLSELDLREGFAGAVRVTIPTSGVENKAEENVPIRGLGREFHKNTYLYNIKADASGKLCSAGAYGILLLFTGYGDSVSSCLSQPSRNAEKLRCKDKQFRTDLVTRFNEDLTELEMLVGEVKV